MKGFDKDWLNSYQKKNKSSGAEKLISTSILDINKKVSLINKEVSTRKRNKWELSYGNHLQNRLLAREITYFRFEALKFRLADRTWYTPDYFVILPNGQIEMHEVKGFWRQSGRIKIKVAAEQYTMFQWLAVTKPTSEENHLGLWKYEYFGARH